MRGIEGDCGEESGNKGEKRGIGGIEKRRGKKRGIERKRGELRGKKKGEKEKGGE